MQVAKGRITTKKSGNGGYKSAWIYIPSKVYKNEDFPFSDNEEVIIEIEEDSLKVTKNDERSRIVRNFGMENATLPRLLEIKAKENRDQPFLYFKELRYSYQETNEISNRYSHGIINILSELDLKSPKIALFMDSCPDFIFTWFGIAKAGCVFVPIDTLSNEGALEHVLNDSDAEILILDYKFLRNFEKIQNNLPKIKKVLIRNAPDDFLFKEKYKQFNSIVTLNIENPKIDLYNDDPSEILYSWGTTGKPKGFVIRNVVLIGIALGYELRDLGFDKATKIYCPMSLSNSTAHFFVVMPAIFYNKSLIITKEFDPSTFWKEIHEFEPECFCYYGPHLTNLLYKKPRVNDRIHSLKFAYGFGAGMDLWKAFEDRFGIPLYECWSHSEGIGVTMNKLGSEGGKRGSIGTPLDFIELKIVDSNGKKLAPGLNNVGEIAVRRKSGKVFEYYKKPEETDVKVDKDNWIFTGDFGYMDYDGFVYFKGRSNEIITKGKEKIYTRDIERVANSHPNIIESSVKPIYNNGKSNLEFKITAITLKDRSISHEEFSDYLFHNLAYFHVPRYIELIEELPKSSGIDMLRGVLPQDWKDFSFNNDVWDCQIKDFLIK